MTAYGVRCSSCGWTASGFGGEQAALDAGGDHEVMAADPRDIHKHHRTVVTKGGATGAPRPSFFGTPYPADRVTATKGTATRSIGEHGQIPLAIDAVEIGCINGANTTETVLDMGAARKLHALLGEILGVGAPA